MAVEPLAVAVAGAAGRMGQTLVAMLAEDEVLRLACALEHGQHPHLGQDSGVLAGVAANGVPLQADCGDSSFEVLIDFSGAGAVLSNLRLCRDRGCALVLGSTGWGEEVHAELQAAASAIPIVCAPNMSAGVNVLFGLLKIAAKTLGLEADIEITEAHHRQKKDAPSGTALRMGEILAAARGQILEDCAVYGRHGDDVPRLPGQIGFSVLRSGNLVGEHTVRFTTDAEEVEIGHRAFSRSCFAGGALSAARWLRGRGPGLYGMEEVLDLGTR